MGTSDSAFFGVSFGLHHYALDGVLVLVPHGELDAWADQELAPQLVELLHEPGLDVIVDLRRVTFLDAGGLRMLLRIRSQVAQGRGRLRLVRAGPRVWRVLRLTRLDRAFTVVESIDHPSGEAISAQLP